MRLRVGMLHSKALRQLRQGMGYSQHETIDRLHRVILTLSDQIREKFSSKVLVLKLSAELSL